MAPKKIHVAYVRLCAQDHVAIRRLAAEAGLSVAEFLWRSSLGRAVRATVPAINRQACVEFPYIWHRPSHFVARSLALSIFL